MLSRIAVGAFLLASCSQSSATSTPAYVDGSEFWSKIDPVLCAGIARCKLPPFDQGVPDGGVAACTADLESANVVDNDSLTKCTATQVSSCATKLETASCATFAAMCTLGVDCYCGCI